MSMNVWRIATDKISVDDVKPLWRITESNR